MSHPADGDPIAGTRNGGILRAAHLPKQSENAWQPSHLHAPAPFRCDHCEKSYTTLHHLEIHQREHCNVSKRKLADLLASTKEFWEDRKRRRLTRGEEPSEGASALEGRTQPEGTVGSQSGGTVGEPSSAIPQDIDDPLSTRRTRRTIRLPARYRQDVILPPTVPAVDVANAPAPNTTASAEPCVQLTPPLPLVVHKTLQDAFGVVRVYRIRGSFLTHDPDQIVTLRKPPDTNSVGSIDPSGGTPPDTTPTADTTGSKATPTDTHRMASTDPNSTTPAKAAPPEVRWGPFPSKSSFHLADWYWGTRNKSFADFQKLITLFKQPDFSMPDILDVDWKTAFKALGANREDLPDHEAEWIHDDGWKMTSVTIDVPFHRRMRNPGTESYAAGILHHRSIVSVIKEKISNPKAAQRFHYQPYVATWKPTKKTAEVEIYGELYTSRVFREAHEEIQALPTTTRNEGLERVVVGMMFWSDSTQLTSFGGASLWPLYLFFGNESKYQRCQPSDGLGEQIAYFITLSDTFKEYLHKRNDGKVPTDAIFSHCARELFQKQWGIMLDDELIDAMEHGLVLMCPDGKMLIAGLRKNGGCPCHCCVIEKADLWKMGSPLDMERDERRRSEEDQKLAVDSALRAISAGGAVDGARVEDLLKPHSMVPVQNAFCARLSGLSFKILPALVVDLMHEFEIGVWKKLFIHLIRLLEAFTSEKPKGSTLTADLDSRYRMTPSFGRDSIRSFAENASEMKRRAARDYEDLLQCALPAFDSLLPEPHNEILMKLLYICAQWHAVAKLRMHHDHTLQLLDFTTAWLGAQMRLFNHKTCLRVRTKELQKESEAREKRDGSGKGKTGSGTRKAVKFNIFTIKFHYLGDYTLTIRRFGTTDSFSTETGELFHRLPKSWFERTDRREYVDQLAQIERRRARLDQIRHTNIPGETSRIPTAIALSSGEKVEEVSSSEEEDEDEDAEEDEDNGLNDSWYTIGSNQNLPVDIASFARNPEIPYHDPYVLNFVQKLKVHLLPRIIKQLGFPLKAFKSADWINVSLNRLYSHKILRVEYTTYDVRRDQDIIHVGTPHSDVLLLDKTVFKKSNAKKSFKHPYRYGKVIGVFHSNVAYIGTLPDSTRNTDTICRIDFVWVHWYDILEVNKEFALDRLSLRPLASDDALGFLDPSDIVRGVHLIPQFSGKKLLPSTRSRWIPADEEVWDAYYINKFADRDLFMRYQFGMAVGHKYMRRLPVSMRTPVPSIPADFDHHTSFPEDASGTTSASDEGQIEYVDPPTDDDDRDDPGDEE